MEQANKYDRYWRFKDYRDVTATNLKVKLESTAYSRLNITTKRNLFHYVRRLELGLLCYYNCSTKELKRFQTDRHIMPSRTSRNQIIEALESGDATPSFTRYLDLPAELRSRINELYLNELPRVLAPCAQPPLTRVCRLIRNESLPLFYSIIRFELEAACEAQARTHTASHDSRH